MSYEPNVEAYQERVIASFREMLDERQRLIMALEADRAERIKNHNQIFAAWQADKRRIEALEAENATLKARIDAAINFIDAKIEDKAP